MSELLPAKEPKGIPEESPIQTSSPLPDSERIKNLILNRKEKLETIKPVIPLKTYHLILEKLEKEENDLMNNISQKKKQADIQNAPQLLPKAFFEKKYLKAKSIRID